MTDMTTQETAAMTADGVTIQLEGCELSIPDLKKPVWHGDYHEGKLSVFIADATPSIIPACISVVSVFTDAAGEDNVMIAHYELHVTTEAIVAHIQSQVVIVYAASKTRPAPSTYVPGPETLQ